LGSILQLKSVSDLTFEGINNGLRVICSSPWRLKVSSRCSICASLKLNSLSISSYLISRNLQFDITLASDGVSLMISKDVRLFN